MIRSTRSLYTVGLLGAVMASASCREREEAADEALALTEATTRSPNNPVRTRPGPSRRGRRRTNDGPPADSRAIPEFPVDFRTLDGSGNNLAEPTWGTAEAEFLRTAPAAYEDGASAPSGSNRPNPRTVSNAVSAQITAVPNAVDASDFIWQWGQFLDHDIDLSPEVEPEERFDVQVPTGDPAFDPLGSGTVVMPMHRSLYVTVDGVREQLNAITAYIDASQVYGSDDERGRALRTLDGTGRLKTSAGNLLPFNVDGLPNAAPTGAPAESFFVAGDFRANEQVGLTVMHTLFVREHNRLADDIRRDDPELDDEAIYQRARAIVAAQMQAITYREFLPVLLGPNALSDYRGYQPSVNPGISNTFATAAFRLGHSMLSENLRRLTARGTPIDAGHLSLADAFFGVDEIVGVGLEPYLRGLADQRAQAIDPMVIDEVRNFLFGPPGAGGFDLASLNIQRGRDHGLPGYNDVRSAFGLPRVRSFAEINPNPEVQARLQSVYANVDLIDPWAGGLCEPPTGGGMVGETFRAVLIDQFERLRDGDRFWYQRYLPEDLANAVRGDTLADIIRRNTNVAAEIPDDVFHVGSGSSRR